jgi:hypothetical protein
MVFKLCVLAFLMGVVSFSSAMTGLRAPRAVAACQDQGCATKCDFYHRWAFGPFKGGGSQCFEFSQYVAMPQGNSPCVASQDVWGTKVADVKQIVYPGAVGLTCPKINGAGQLGFTPCAAGSGNPGPPQVVQNQLIECKKPS